MTVRSRIIISPLLLGVALQMHHHYFSKFLIDTLKLLKFGPSYFEVLRFEKNAAINYGIELQGITSDSLVQHVADNVDHNICALDGRNTFHGMGIIANVTPGLKVTLKSMYRQKITAEEINITGRILIVHRKSNNSVLLIMNYDLLHPGSKEDKISNLHSLLLMLWHL